MASEMNARDALDAAGFQPDFNVCVTCKHHGSRHDLSNKCLDCGDYFGSMTLDQQWEHGIAELANRGWVLLEVGAVAPQVAAYHPTDGHNLGPGSWEEDEEGFVTERLSYENREGDPAFNGAFDKW